MKFIFNIEALQFGVGLCKCQEEPFGESGVAVTSSSFLCIYLYTVTMSYPPGVYKD